MNTSSPLSDYFRLASAQEKALRRLGITTLRDLLYHFPVRYEAAGTEATSRELAPGAKVTLIGIVSKLEAKKLWKSRRTVTEGWFEDSAGRVKIMWFNQPYMASYVPQGTLVRLTGTVGGKSGKPYIANPEVEKISNIDTGKNLFAPKSSEIAADARRGESSSGDVLESTATEMQEPRNNADAAISGLFPVYPESQGVTSRWFYHAIRRLFDNDIHKKIEDPIPADVRESLKLPDIAASLVFIHQPENEKHAEAARKRFSFEEMFVLQTARAMERAENDSERAFAITNAAALAEKFLSTVPVEPTGAQRRAISDILTNFEKSQPMARLLEGDVGSGKTLVAAASAYAIVNSRPPQRESGTLQVAYMAPTEILAQQHFDSFIEYFRHLPINIALMTGSGCKKFPSKTRTGRGPDADITDISRTQLLKWVENGEIAVVIGTHALIQKSVRFQNLAYVIVDEQHRFGTSQRKALVRRTDAEQTRNVAEVHDPLLYRDLTYRIREALFKVKKELGGGHKEVVYQRALAEEFTRSKLTFSREKRIPIMYNKKEVGIYQPDFVIENKVVVELKALNFVGTSEKKQLWSYLKGSEYHLGLLVNFGPKELTIDRVVYDKARISASVPHEVRVRSASVPHFLSMTATPIPRTLALTIYGDLDISVLDELPPGRAKITTTIVAKTERAACYEKVRDELKKGRQAYVICPRIEEPDPAKINALQAKSAKAEATRLKKEVFPEFSIGLLHGAMKPKEKDDAMREFTAGKTQILVATSVVEVGVNVPNATVILIEGAERFGLAQLHQLRGRVMRSSHLPYCFLLPETRGEVSMKRLKALEKSSDGFKLAEVDLETRGPGDLYGMQQWGISDLGMEALKNPRLIAAARETAQSLVQKDPTLSNHPGLAERVANAGKELHGE